MTKKNLIKLLAEVRMRQHDHEATANPKNLTAYPRRVRKIVQATWTAEAVFVKVESNDAWHTADKADAERRAATKAYRELQAKVGKPISYYIGPSHPNHC